MHYSTIDEERGVPIFLDGEVEENMDPDDDNDWLHRNETYRANDTITTRDLLTAGT